MHYKLRVEYHDTGIEEYHFREDKVEIDIYDEADTRDNRCRIKQLLEATEINRLTYFLGEMNRIKVKDIAVNCTKWKIL